MYFVYFVYLGHLLFLIMLMFVTRSIGLMAGATGVAPPVLQGLPLRVGLQPMP